MRWAEDLVGWAVGLFFLSAAYQSPQSLPYSALPLELIGVVVSSASPSNSACLIRCIYPAKKDDIFQPGQKTFDFAEIEEIRFDGVVIQNLLTHDLEFLTFSKNKPVVKTPPSPPPPVVAKSSDAVDIELPKDTVNHYLKNLPDLLESAFAAPRYREGRNGQKSIEGFEISRIKEAGIVEQLGLKNGDVILDMNGEPLDSLATVLRLLGGIQNASQAKMTVLRDGQKMNFVFNRK